MGLRATDGGTRDAGDDDDKTEPGVCSRFSAE